MPQRVSWAQERFKECEKDAKLKPFAKAALSARHEKVDPAVAAKQDCQRWPQSRSHTLG